MDIDYLTCQEPSQWYTCTDHPHTNAAIATAKRAGYTIFAHKHTLSITKDYTLTPRIHDTPQGWHDGRIQVHTFHIHNSQHILIIGVYAYQRGYKEQPKQNTSSTQLTIPQSASRKPKSQTQQTQTPNNDTKTTCSDSRQLQNTLNKICKEAQKQYPDINIIIAGDLQHTLQNPLQRIGPILSPPPYDILTYATMKLQLTSIIPTHHSTTQYTTHIGVHNAAGIDHILIPHPLIHKTIQCAVDHTQALHQIPTDHFLIYADIKIFPTHKPTIPCKQTKYLYNQLATIPLMEHGNGYTPDKTKLTQDELQRARTVLDKIRKAHTHQSTQAHFNKVKHHIKHLTLLTEKSHN